jgi:hypothetical protein
VKQPLFTEIVRAQSPYQSQLSMITLPSRLVRQFKGGILLRQIELKVFHHVIDGGDASRSTGEVVKARSRPPQFVPVLIANCEPIPVITTTESLKRQEGISQPPPLHFPTIGGLQVRTKNICSRSLMTTGSTGPQDRSRCRHSLVKLIVSHQANR